MTLFRQFWVDCHSNGACYRPLSPGSLPHTDEAVRRTLVLPAWAKHVPDLADQYASAFEKIAANMGELAEHQAGERE